jgi:putative membrane protein
MSDPDPRRLDPDPDAAPTARVIEVDLAEPGTADDLARLQVAPPQVIATERTERITPSAPAIVPVVARAPVRRRDRVVTLGIAGVAIFFVGWLAVDAAAWVAAAFERGPALGALAATAVVAGVAGAGAVIAREVVSLFRLRNVEAIHQKFADNRVLPADGRKAIADVLAVVPKEHETQAAIAAFQRQVQLHHSTAQQLEILSRTVMKVLDRRAEAHVRTGVLRAFGITAISPTALSDAAFFLACGVRMVRGIAASYGHRPTAATTVHLLRRLVLEAGKLGAVDIASASLVQHLGGAVTERIATSAADAVYASYRMARLGIIVMDLCRPVPFQQDDVPSVGSLVGNVIRRRADAQVPPT